VSGGAGTLVASFHAHLLSASAPVRGHRGLRLHHVPSRGDAGPDSLASQWEQVDAGPTNFNAVAGSATEMCFVVGDEGTILHWDGTALLPEASGTTANLRGVAVASDTLTYAWRARHDPARQNGVWSADVPVTNACSMLCGRTTLRRLPWAAGSRARVCRRRLDHHPKPSHRQLLRDHIATMPGHRRQSRRGVTRRHHSGQHQRGFSSRLHQTAGRGHPLGDRRPILWVSRGLLFWAAGTATQVEVCRGFPARSVGGRRRRLGGWDQGSSRNCRGDRTQPSSHA